MDTNNNTERTENQEVGEVFFVMVDGSVTLNPSAAAEWDKD